MAPIVLIGGGTGVGTSKLAAEFSRLQNLPSPLSTDAIREVLRSAMNPGLLPTLGQSTYLAGQTEHYAQKLPEVQRMEILRAYKSQCDAVSVGVEGILLRAQEENHALVLEGVHLRPGAFRKPETGRDLQEFLIYVADPDIHRERFSARAREAPARGGTKYLTHFREIRWIHDYLVDRAKRTGVLLIENGGPISETLAAMQKAYLTRQE